jgi:hypothetical protein
VVHCGRQDVSDHHRWTPSRVLVPIHANQHMNASSLGLSSLSLLRGFGRRGRYRGANSSYGLLH